MFVEGLKARLSRAPIVGDYVLALGFVAVAVLVRAALGSVIFGTAPFLALFPAVVLAGLFCGTAPAVIAATVGAIANTALFPAPPDAGQLSLLAFIPACATVIWASSVLRRFAVSAAQAEARLAEVFRQIPGAAAILAAPDGKLLLRSAQSDTVLGQRERNFDRTGDLAAYGALHPDGRRFAPDEYPIVRALKTGEVVPGEQFSYRRPNGEVADLEVYAGPVRGPDGAILAAVGMAFDVSDKVAADRRLRESEAVHRATAERLRAAVDAGALGLWELDLATDRIKLDAALARMLGLPSAPLEMSRADFRRLVDPADLPRAMAVFAEALAAGGVYADELRMKTTRNTTRWFVTRGAVFADERKVIGVTSDVTDRREREEALRAALDARDLLIREADHRIKNSLQLVVALLDLQLRRVADADAKAALRAAMTRVNAVADAHLALQHSPDLRSIAVDQMLADLCGRVGSLNPAVATLCEAQAGMWLDAEQAIPLGLIASELLTNALRHAYAPDVPGTVRVTLLVERGSLALTVADRGVGMPATPRRAGLGTSVIDGLARQIGAEVLRQSAPGEGTTIIVRLKAGSQNGRPVSGGGAGPANR